jgi:hypothetical protein
MASRSLETSWTANNQAKLVGEFARLKELFGLEAAAGSDGAIAPVPIVLEPPAAIDVICDLFGLSTFERDLLLLCAGVEMDSQLAALCGSAQSRAQPASATFGLALAILPDPHWSALTPGRPLRRNRLVELGAGPGLTSAPLSIDERVLHYLAGINLLDPRLERLLDVNLGPAVIADEHELIAAQASRLCELHGQQTPILHLCGDDSRGQEDVAAVAARAAGRQLLILRLEDLEYKAADLEPLGVLWERETLLLPGMLLVQCGQASLTPPARRLAETLPGPLMIASGEPVRLNRPLVRLAVDKPKAAGQKRLWERALGPAAAHWNGDLDRLADQFRMSAQAIFSTGALAVGANGTIDAAQLWNKCRSLAQPRLDDLAQRIVPGADWDDLVVPDLQMQTLRQLAAQVRNRMLVHESWGFADKGRRGLGASTLFAGESGTGKTLAAEVLAGELRLDLYRIDLSCVVSKYIGETEKNLKRIFDAAEDGGALLLFDEADALFGKRSDVKDSHDRYANIEVSYLLQRMEAYQGLAILTTNLKSALDRAFQRRLRFVVNFPFPDAVQREAIWERAFPARAPTRGLVFKRLAQLNMTGGSIRNIALNAAFFAAEAQRPIEMAHVLQAARLEAQKVERPLSEAEIRGWV